MALLTSTLVPLLGVIAGFDTDGTDTTLDSGDAGLAAGAAIVFLLVYIAVFIAVSALMYWGLFEKAGEPGWASLVPFYNLWILVKISGKEGFWFILFLVPCLNIVALIVISLAIAERFGKEPIYALGLIVLPIVFFPILGFGSAQYQPIGATGGPPPGGAPPPGGPPPGGTPPQSF